MITSYRYFNDLASAENQKLRIMNTALVTSSGSAKVRVIDRPATGTAGQAWNLQEMMGLKDNKSLYLSIRVSRNKYMNFMTYNTFQCTIRDYITWSPMDIDTPLKNQDAQVIADIMALVRAVN